MHSSRTRDSSQRRAPNHSQDYVYDFCDSHDDEVLEDASDDDSLPRPEYISAEKAIQVSSSQPSATDVKESVAWRVLKHVGAVLLCEIPIAAVALEIDPRTWSTKVDENSVTHVFAWLPEEIRAEVAERAKKALLERTESVIADEGPRDQESDTALGNRRGGERKLRERFLDGWDDEYDFNGGNNDHDDADDSEEEDLQDEMGGERDGSDAFDPHVKAESEVDKFYRERQEL